MADYDENKIEVENPIVVSPANPKYNKNFCKYCGKELQPRAAFCSSCGKPQGSVPIQQPQPVVAPNVSNTTTVVVEGSNSNSIGIAGFIIALLGLVFCWVPLVNLILWFLGLIFSLIGLFKSPRGMAIAGLVLSLIIIFIIISIWGTIFNALDTFFNK